MRIYIIENWRKKHLSVQFYLHRNIVTWIHNSFSLLVICNTAVSTLHFHSSVLCPFLEHLRNRNLGWITFSYFISSVFSYIVEKLHRLPNIWISGREVDRAAEVIWTFLMFFAVTLGWHLNPLQLLWIPAVVFYNEARYKLLSATFQVYRQWVFDTQKVYFRYRRMTNFVPLLSLWRDKYWGTFKARHWTGIYQAWVGVIARSYQTCL